MPIIDTQVGPTRTHTNNGSRNSTREDLTFTIPEAPGLFSSLRENLREWRRTSRIRIPEEYARGEAVLPVTEMRPWYRDFGNQIKSLFEKPTEPIGIFNRAQEKKRAMCGAVAAIAGGGGAYWLAVPNKLIVLGVIAGYLVGETIGIVAFKKQEYPPDIWQDYQLQRASWVNSVLVHAMAILALILPYYISRMLNPVKTTVQVVDISPLLLQMPPSLNKAGGGGGGGARTPTPPSKGKAPEFSKTQMAPPEVTIPKIQPLLPVKPSIIGPPEMKLPDMAQNVQFGDPLQGISGPPSAGPGFGGGIGTGEGTGVGSGTGAGFGPGQGGGAGGGLYSVGGNVLAPVPIYKPEPPYSEQARKAKYQGTVVLWIVVDAAGNVTDAQVVKPLGMGLDQNAVTTVRTWKFKPAMRNGAPVPVKVMVEVSFRLF